MTGPVRDCLHARRHEHGELLAYVKDRCRCTPCRAAARADGQRRARLHAYGRPLKVSAHPALAHIKMLQQAGMGVRQIAAAAGVDRAWIGRAQANPDGLVYRSKADLILSVTAEPTATVRVPAVGSKRRLQALAAQGWSLADLGRRAGLSGVETWRVAHDRNEVLIATHVAVCRLYDQLWDKQPATRTAHERSVYTKALTYAKSRNWASPLAWDDDEIDDPDARPHGHIDPALFGYRRHHRRAAA